MLVLEKRSWLSLLVITKGGPITRIWLRLLIVVSVATVATVLHEEWGYFDPGLTVTPFSLIGLALGIFLGFRNNTSYDRFWEGRRLWGGVVNTTRTLSRQIQTLIGPGNDKNLSEPELAALHKELVYRVIAYVHALRHHLRDQQCPGDAGVFLPAAERDQLEGIINPPIAILQGMGARFRQEWQREHIDAMHLPLLEQSLASLTDLQGACERIKSTPVPASYTLLIHRLVAFYVFALPFGLVSATAAFTPVVVALIAYAFLGLDAIGDEIEEPFGEEANDLPLSAISRMIEVNLRQSLGESEGVPPLLRPQNGFLH